MKLLVAAVGGIPGEIVIPLITCDTEGCGCGDGWLGLSSRQLVTVAEVRDVDVSRADLEATLRAYYADCGWAEDADEMGDGCAEELLEEAEVFAAGWRVVRIDDEVVSEP